MIEETGETLFFDSTGFSMWPYLTGKEKLIIKKGSLSKIRLGDLVVYRAGEELICHRLVKFVKSEGGPFYFTKADASFGPPEALKKEQILGRVSCFIKNNRIYNLEGRWARTKNRLILLVLPLVNLVSDVYVNLFVKK